VHRIDRHVLDLGLPGLAGVGDLQMADDLVPVDRDEHAAVVDVRAELLLGVLGELEQPSELRPRAGVLGDADLARALAAPPLWHKHDTEAVRILERDLVFGPVRVGRGTGSASNRATTASTAAASPR
jgi:hypothetical protein